ncbi:ATP-binding protein [filamentous cyanobacterium LEGE 11480]|uniref:ATP-binding protein n=1 Tax=Romeriopsis navalis LEGE 11480 TaxID=2777977 RepID=A0A928Z5T6_9CYAN|nr:ATP-binding protein [Romeriopsis navalis]MBE9032327.1 ATP-binding protein [Romeriopsis navalis LEGE 11480]
MSLSKLSPKLSKRVSTAIMNALSSGVVPRVGLDHIAVGRDQELKLLKSDLENIAAGGATFRFVIGRYGAGKSFMLQLLRNTALNQGFVVADADITPERRLVGSGGSGLATYRELIHHLSTKSRPGGGALSVILERWIAGIQNQVAKESGKRPTDEGFDDLVEDKIREVTQDVADLVNGFEFASVIIAYWSGYRNDDPTKKESALRWLRGEFATRTEARAALGVRVIIDDDTWYDYIKLMAKFVADIGYNGLIIMLDEAIHLAKIPASVTRQNNYDKLLAIFNDSMQGHVAHLGTLIGGTPQFLEDPRRGLFTDPAWQRRTSQSRLLAQSGIKDEIAPVIRLEPLDQKDLAKLLKRLSDVHQTHYSYQSKLSTQDFKNVLRVIGDRMGAEAFLTPGEIVRDFIGVLNVLHQNPKISITELLKLDPPKPSHSGKKGKVDVNSDFAEFSI